MGQNLPKIWNDLLSSEFSPTTPRDGAKLAGNHASRAWKHDSGDMEAGFVRV
jgi:hypothetical protein